MIRRDAVVDKNAATTAEPTEPHGPAIEAVSDSVPESLGTRPAEQRRPGRGLLLYLLRRPGVALSGLFVLLVAGWALLPQVFASSGPYNQVGPPLRPPSLTYLFGTDNLGRDIYSRVVYGAAISLEGVLLAVSLGLVVGSTIGLVSGFAGGRVDAVVMRFVDVLLAIPGLLLALVIVTGLGYGNVNASIAVGATSVSMFARIMRAQVLRVRSKPYVEASKALGRRWSGTMILHVLPNSIGPIIALWVLNIGTAVIALAALSFLGFGARPPSPQWGALVAQGEDYLSTSWWLAICPGIVVVVFVVAINRLARAAQREELND